MWKVAVKLAGNKDIVILLLKVFCNSLPAEEGNRDGRDPRRERAVLGLRLRALAGPIEAQGITPHDFADIEETKIRLLGFRI